MDDPEWLRGWAWALGITLGTFTYYWKSMRGTPEGRLTMTRSVLADAAENIR